MNSIISFFQVNDDAKSDLHYDVFDKESHEMTKKCELNIDDTNDCDVGLSQTLESHTVRDQVSFSL